MLNKKSVTVFLSYILQQVNHVRAILQRLYEKQLFVKAEKYKFHVHCVSFLGFILEKGQFKTDPKKICAIAEWPIPADHKQLQWFLGFANFYRPFIKDYSRVAPSLTQRTSTLKAFSWTPEADCTFGELKARFSSAPILCHPDPSRQFIV